MYALKVTVEVDEEIRIWDGEPSTNHKVVEYARKQLEKELKKLAIPHRITLKQVDEKDIPTELEKLRKY
jgi:hypothetical protein